MKALFATVAALAASLLLAGVAQADDQAFLDQIPPRNYFSMWTTDAGRLAQGYQLCAMIRSGTPPHVVAASWGQPWVNTAQHGLCPDTLGGQAQP